MLLLGKLPTTPYPAGLRLICSRVNVILDPDYKQTLTQMQMLSTDSRSFSFDNRANGYARGEGVGTVILKPLSDAIRDNDTIRAIIRASGANHDGRTPGITQPSNKAQARLIKETYRKAGLSMRYTRFFEAHGTGTAIGDPIEAEAIIEAFAGVREVGDPLYIGAVKSNIGHLEGAAGIAGLIKTILVLETGVIPPNANFKTVNRKIDTKESSLAFPTSPTTWPSLGVRRASINSFGYGGSNSHLILDDAYSFLTERNLCGNHRTALSPVVGAENSSLQMIPHATSMQSSSVQQDAPLKTPKLLVWSATDEQTLRLSIERCQEYCSTKLAHGEKFSSFIHDLAYTLDSRRSNLPWQSCAVIKSGTDVGALVSTVSSGTSRKGQTPRIAFAFTGQGAQWYAMGRELFNYEIFGKIVDRAETYLKKLGCPWSVKGKFHMIIIALLTKSDQSNSGKVKANR